MNIIKKYSKQKGQLAFHKLNAYQAFMYEINTPASQHMAADQKLAIKASTSASSCARPALTFGS